MVFGMERGYTHVYYGNGKGKTTAALGLSLRAAGCGRSVIIIQFLKDSNSGELDCLARLDNIKVFRGKAPGAMFVRDMSDEQIAATKDIHDRNLTKALESVRSGNCDMLVLDEVIDAYNLKLLNLTIFNELLDNKPGALELVLTGHNPTDDILHRADYVTEMIKHKHPFDDGLPARRGVEF